MASLTVVGTGIQFAGQTAPAARTHIEQADKVVFLVADPATSLWITSLNPTAESLHVFYNTGQYRLTSYLAMVERVMSLVREGLNVCFVSYGHPGVFAFPMHESIRRARSEGYKAEMLPAISAEDCLFSDLGIDPGASGCQSFEATDFLVYRRKFDTCCALILWQIGVTGEIGYKEKFSLDGLHVLVDVLQKHYGTDHEAIVYEAAQYNFCDPSIQRTSIAKIPEARVTNISTLYIPPKEQGQLDLEMLDRLGIPYEDVKMRSYVTRTAESEET